MAGDRREYDQRRRESSMKYLWEKIQGGAPEGVGRSGWELGQEQILRTCCLGWTWNQILERIRLGPLSIDMWNE